MNRFFQLLFFGSLFFVVSFLYRYDYLQWPVIRSMPSLLAAWALLFFGFLVSALIWQRYLVATGIDVSPAVGIASAGLSIFGKYVPGKVWLIIGRAAYVQRFAPASLQSISVSSLHAQIVGVWAALAVGSIGLLFFVEAHRIAYVSLTTWVVLSVVIFTRSGERFLGVLINRILKQKIEISTLNGKAILQLLPWYLVWWVSWSLGFYLFASSFELDVAWYLGFSFPLAVALGILSVLVPGGLGVREGVLAACLVSQGLPLPAATTIAVSSRLWFVVGEFFIFLIGVAANDLVNAQSKQTP